MSNRETYMGVIVAMLIATTIGSFSVFVVGTVAKLIMNDLGLSYSVMGASISVQRVASTLSAPYIGYMIDCIGPFRVLTVAAVFSILSLFITPLSKELWAFLLTRIMAGAVFPAYWPSCTKIASLSIPKNRLGLAIAIFESGSIVGVVLTYILIPYTESWGQPFIVLATVSLLLLPIMVLLLPKNVGDGYRYCRRGRSAVDVAIKHGGLLRNTILVFFAFLLALQPWAFYTSWLSTFLVEKLRVELEDIWIPMTIFLLIGMVFGMLSSAVSDRMGGLKGRKTVLVSTLAITSISLLMLAIVEQSVYTWTFLAISIISHRAFLPLAWTIISDTTPEAFTGTVSGVNALAGQIAMMIAPVIIAYTREVLGTFDSSVALLSLFTAASIPLYLQLKPIKVNTCYQ
ncbi:MAG: MFS transporter [Ignisphaera sp.]|nr:MFS transporter [Ignisphaera sp.]MCX8167693.1 MFS transporter [Ignisphaera sp.]MDW8085683.1 MFS transporter [Ignisphaera sp.]